VKYRAIDLQIILDCSGAKWHFAIVDDEQEPLTKGSNADYIKCCHHALAAFDSILGEEQE
jgi:hypothetical protein